MDDQRPSTEAKCAILGELYPAQVRIVGPENLIDLCDGVTFEDDEAAFRIDVKDAIATLADSLAVVSFVWMVFSSLRGKAVPPPAEIDQLVIEAVAESHSLDQAQRIRIYVAVEKRHVADAG